MPITVRLKYHRFAMKHRPFVRLAHSTTWGITGFFSLGFGPLGIYHTSGELETAAGRTLEYEYSMSGVESKLPGSNNEFTCFKTITLGVTHRSGQEIQAEMRRMRRVFDSQSQLPQLHGGVFATFGSRKSTRAPRFLAWIKPTVEQQLPPDDKNE